MARNTTSAVQITEIPLATDPTLGLKVGDKVNWSRAKDNGVEGPLTIVQIKVLSPKFAQAFLASTDGRGFRQTILAESLTLAK